MIATLIVAGLFVIVGTIGGWILYAGTTPKAVSTS